MDRLAGPVPTDSVVAGHPARLPGPAGAALRRPRAAQAHRPLLDPRPARRRARPAPGRPRARVRHHGGHRRRRLHLLAAVHRRARLRRWRRADVPPLPAVRGHDRAGGQRGPARARPTSASSRRSRASSRSTSARRRGPSTRPRRWSTPSPTRRGAACTATSTATPPRCAPSSPTTSAWPRSASWSATAPRSCWARRRRRCSSPLDELVTPWPSYGLYPAIAHRARGHAVPVPGFGAQAVLRAVNERTRLVALCNPNDPTGELVARRRAALAARGAARARRRAARRGAARLRRRRGARRRAGAGRGVPAPARLPHLLQGLGPGRPARGLRDRRARAPSRCSSSSSPSSGSTSSPRPARSRRCATPAAWWRAARRWWPPSARG